MFRLHYYGDFSVSVFNFGIDARAWTTLLVCNIILHRAKRLRTGPFFSGRIVRYFVIRL